MPRRKRKLASGRYDERLICARIEARRRKLGVEVKELIERVGLGQPDYSRKVRALVAWSMADLEAIADALDAPTGWPFVDERVGEAFDRISER